MRVVPQLVHKRLVFELAVEGYSNGLQQQARVLVICRVGVDGDVATGNHLGWIPMHVSLECSISNDADLRIVVGLNLGEEGELFGGQTERHVAALVAR